MFHHNGLCFIRLERDFDALSGIGVDSQCGHDAALALCLVDVATRLLLGRRSGDRTINDVEHLQTGHADFDRTGDGIAKLKRVPFVQREGLLGRFVLLGELHGHPGAVHLDLRGRGDSRLGALANGDGVLGRGIAGEADLDTRGASDMEPIVGVEPVDTHTVMSRHLVRLVHPDRGADDRLARILDVEADAALEHHCDCDILRRLDQPGEGDFLIGIQHDRLGDYPCGGRDRLGLPLRALGQGRDGRQDERDHHGGGDHEFEPLVHFYFPPED